MFEKLKRIFAEPKPDPEVKRLKRIVTLLLEELKLKVVDGDFGYMALTKVKTARKKRTSKKTTPPTPQEQDWP